MVRLEKKLGDVKEAIEILKKEGKTRLGDNSLIKKYEQIEKELQQKFLAYNELEKKIQKLKQENNELKQEKALFSNCADFIESKNIELEKSCAEIREKFEKEKQTAIENEQAKLFLDETVKIVEKEKHLTSKKYYKTIIVSVIAIAVIAGAYSLFFAQLAGEQYHVDDPVNAPNGFIIQNLRGDTIDTWMSWRIPEGGVIQITVSGASEEQLEIIKEAVESQESIEIDNYLTHKGLKGTTSVFYKGWAGAMLQASKEQTEFNIPTDFEFTSGGIGDINISLVNYANADGFSGWTRSIIDEPKNQILKSEITVHNSNTLSKNQLASLVRHEMGHALGLAHSTDPEDLMAAIMTTNFPYISPCDLSAMVKLYDNGGLSRVVCEI